MIAEDRMNQLEEEKQETLSFIHELDEKLIMGEIDPAEYQTMLSEKQLNNMKENQIEKMHGQPRQEKAQHSRNRKVKAQLGIAGAILVLIALISFFSQQGLLTPTGFVIGEKQVSKAIDYNQAFSQYTETQLELENIIGLRVSGTLEGTGAKVKLRINGTDYLIADIRTPSAENLITGAVIGEEETPPYAIITDKTSYQLGETVTITTTPETENKSLYISYGEETHILEENTYAPEIPGEYQAIALIVLPDNILRLETNFTVIEPTNETTTEETPTESTGYEFTEICTETCTLPETSNPILIIEPDANSTLTITQITITQTKENEAPIQTKTILDITIISGQTTTLDLNEYFSDPDGDTVQYDINEIPEIDATINQNALTITSATPGTYTAFIYATDGDKLVTSNTFQIAITETTIPGLTANLTTNQTINETPVIIAETGDSCSNPDPNKRPIECLDNAEYFQEQTILIENTARTPIARITPIGNLIISGEVIEQDSFIPAEGDYTIGYEDSYGNKQTTVWFESSTGNVHLKGNLYEEKINSEPAPGSFVIRNKKGIVLVWGDSVTGNMYLRGNVISNRNNIMR